MTRPALALMSLGMACLCVHCTFALVRALCMLTLSLPRGAFFALPPLSTALPVLALTLALYLTGRLSYRLLDRSGVFPDAQPA